MFERAKTYAVRNTRVETTGVKTLFLTLVDGTAPDFTAGQLIDVYFPDSSTSLGKPYSLSNPPGQATVTITVRAIGEFSNRLCALKDGDHLLASLPYGTFGPKSQDAPLVMLAAGIGITPFHSIVADSLTKKPNRPLNLFYSAKTRVGLIFHDYFTDLAKQVSNLHVHFFVTQEPDQSDYIRYRRLNHSDLAPLFSSDTEFLICGPYDFVTTMQQTLLTAGAESEQISTSSTSSISTIFR